MAAAFQACYRFRHALSSFGDKVPSVIIVVGGLHFLGLFNVLLRSELSPRLPLLLWLWGAVVFLAINSRKHAKQMKSIGPECIRELTLCISRAYLVENIVAFVEGVAKF